MELWDALRSLYEGSFGNGGTAAAGSAVNYRGRVFRLPRHTVRVRRLIGEGGFAFVFLVEDENEQLFALKRILCQTVEQAQVGPVNVAFSYASY